MSNEGIVVAAGYFTMLKYIAILNGPQLERTLGFECGRLKSGFRIAVLSESEILMPEEFILKGSTRWSGGSIRGVESYKEGLDIRDVISGRGQDENELKVKVAAFFARRGENTPAKLIPRLEHADGMKYPDAEALGPGRRSGVPQFCLLKPRRFTIVRHEGPL